MYALWTEGPRSVRTSLPPSQQYTPERIHNKQINLLNMLLKSKSFLDSRLGLDQALAQGNGLITAHHDQQPKALVRPSLPHPLFIHYSFPLVPREDSAILSFCLFKLIEQTRLIPKITHFILTKVFKQKSTSVYRNSRGVGLDFMFHKNETSDQVLLLGSPHCLALFFHVFINNHSSLFLLTCFEW